MSYQYIKGLGQLWVNQNPPPEDANNVIWLKLPASIFGGSFQLLVWHQADGVSGEWKPLVGATGAPGPISAVVQNTEPEDEDIKLWIDEDELPGNELEMLQTTGTDTSNPMSQDAVTKALDALKEELEQSISSKSVYQMWLDQGNIGTEEDFLNSLKGESVRGESAYEIAVRLGFVGTEAQWIDSLTP